MQFMEIQEGKDAMRSKLFADELGVNSCCVARMSSACATGATMMGDSWFGSIKVCIFFCYACCVLWFIVTMTRGCAFIEDCSDVFQEGPQLHWRHKDRTHSLSEGLHLAAIGPLTSGL